MPTFAKEKILWEEGYERVLGIDEVGVGALAGPLVCAGVIYHEELAIEFVRDSKSLSPKQRDEVFELLVDSVEYSVGVVELEEFDSVGLTKALALGVQRVIDGFQDPPDYVLMDGNTSYDIVQPMDCIVKGDRDVMSLAAASIIAKVSRDRMMEVLHDSFPQFGFSSNMGYGSSKHYEALEAFGPCEAHRKSYQPVKRLLGLSDMV